MNRKARDEGSPRVVSASGRTWSRRSRGELIIDRTRFFLDNVDGILAALQRILLENPLPNAPAPPMAAESL
jgi:hypothetical protein